MSVPSTILLDESCAQLAARVGSLAPTLIFRRSRGFRSEADLAGVELREMLANHGWLGRAIYVAPSFASFTGLLLAARDGAALGALVLVDPSHPRQGPEAMRVLAKAPPSPSLDALRALFTGFGPAWDQACEQILAIRNLGRLPLRVLAGGKFDLGGDLPEPVKLRLLKDRHAMLAEYCRLSTNATMTVVDDAGHDLSRQAPDAVVAAIRGLLPPVDPKPARSAPSFPFPPITGR